MATEKPAITIYVTNTIKVRLEAWKAENKIKSSSAAVEEILSRFFNLTDGDYLTRAELEPIMGKFQTWLVR